VAFGKVTPMIFCHQLFPCSNFSLWLQKQVDDVLH
jgi:hypothetical protein